MYSGQTVTLPTPRTNSKESNDENGSILYPTEAFFTGRKPKQYTRPLHNNSRGKVSYVVRPPGGHVPRGLTGMAYIRRRGELVRALSAPSVARLRLTGLLDRNISDNLSTRSINRSLSSSQIYETPPAMRSLSDLKIPDDTRNPSIERIHTSSRPFEVFRFVVSDSSRRTLPAISSPETALRDLDDGEDQEILTPPTQIVEDEVEDEEEPNQMAINDNSQEEAEEDLITSSIDWDSVVSTPPPKTTRRLSRSKHFQPLEFFASTSNLKQREGQTSK